jgi:thiol-disulfide isomerase/thioredoxin
VTIYTVSNTKGVLYKIKEVPFINEDEKLIDSSYSTTIRDTLVFKIRSSEQRLFRITMSANDMVINFINDVPNVIIHADFFENTYSFEGSTINIALKEFEDEQLVLRKQAHTTSRGLQNLKRLRPQDSRIDSLTMAVNNKLQEVANRYVAFADTTENPVAFMFVYDHIDFLGDHAQTKDFINRAAQRFPDYLPIKTLQRKTLQYLRILEEEYNVGQLLPDLTLPDRNGQPFSTSSLRGKVVFIDFWSTWCSHCLSYTSSKKKARSLFPNDDFEIVSIALDDNLELWKSITIEDTCGYQLIDEKMWEGTAVNTWKFDSIPFNFLISKDGYIIKKGLPPDSLVTVLSSVLSVER